MQLPCSVYVMDYLVMSHHFRDINLGLNSPHDVCLIHTIQPNEGRAVSGASIVYPQSLLGHRQQSYFLIFSLSESRHHFLFSKTIVQLVGQTIFTSAEEDMFSVQCVCQLVGLCKKKKYNYTQSTMFLQILYSVFCQCEMCIIYSLYAAQLWCCYRKSSLQRLIMAYDHAVSLPCLLNVYEHWLLFNQPSEKLLHVLIQTQKMLNRLSTQELLDLIGDSISCFIVYILTFFSCQLLFVSEIN